jgi:hypothetical protein
VTLLCVLDLTDASICASLGISHEELVSLTPSRFILNAQGKNTPTQELGSACCASDRISAVKVPSAAHSDGFCLNIFLDRLFKGEHIAIRNDYHRLRDEVHGRIPLQMKS